MAVLHGQMVSGLTERSSGPLPRDKVVHCPYCDTGMCEVTTRSFLTHFQCPRCNWTVSWCWWFKTSPKRT